MPEDKKLRNLINIDLKTMSILLRNKTNKSVLDLKGFIETALLNGATMDNIKQRLIDDLENNGPIFGSFRAAVKNTVKSVNNRVRDSVEFGKILNVKRWRWVAVLRNTCEDCIARHGKVFTFDEWSEKGLPRAGFTICQENCQCVLLPADTTELAPIRR